MRQGGFSDVWNARLYISYQNSQEIPSESGFGLLEQYHSILGFGGEKLQ